MYVSRFRDFRQLIGKKVCEAKQSRLWALELLAGAFGPFAAGKGSGISQEGDSTGTTRGRRSRRRARAARKARLNPQRPHFWKGIRQRDVLGYPLK